jgi:hypothetical protein
MMLGRKGPDVIDFSSFNFYYGLAGALIYQRGYPTTKFILQGQHQQP